MCNKKFKKIEIILALALAGIVGCLLYRLTPDEIDEECADSSSYEPIVEVQNYVDPSVDPCNDFHQFVCGRFLATAYQKQVTGIFSEERKRANNEFDAMVIGPISTEDSELIKMQKTFYQSCVGEDENSVNREEEVLDLLRQIEGWPRYVNETWEDENFDWTNVMIQCRELGLPFQWFLEFGLHQEQINYLKISYPMNSYRVNNTYMIYLTNKFLQEITYPERDVINAKIQSNLFNFMQELMELRYTERSELSLKTIKELNTLHPVFNWLDIIQNITGDVSLTEETVVASTVDDYFLDLHHLLTATPKSTQAHYILWKIIEHFVPYITHPLNDESNEVNLAENCKRRTRESFPYLSETEYIKKFSVSKVTESATELKNLIKEEFHKRVLSSTWWNTTAAIMYLEEFDNIDIDIGLGSEEILDDELLESNYLYLEDFSFNFKKFTFITALAERSKCYYNSLLSNTNETGIELEKKNLVFHATDIGLFYNKVLNKLIVPPAMLHGIFYDYKRPQYLNFGSLGYVLAAAFMRLFQILTKNDENFLNTAIIASHQCFEMDYHEIYTDEKIDFRIYQLIQEIHSFVLARDIAYTAYQTWVKKNGEESGLPTLSYSPYQLFWIKSSATYCYRNLADESNFYSSFAKYQTVLSARHSLSFAKDFSCQAGTPMNPTKKC